MWSKVLKVTMFIYLIVAIFLGCYIGGNLNSVGAGIGIFVGLFMFGAMFGCIAEIGDNTANMKKSMQSIKKQYYRQLGIVDTDDMNTSTNMYRYGNNPYATPVQPSTQYMNYSQYQNTQEQTNNKQ